jgi:hypothetical protein
VGLAEERKRTKVSLSLPDTPFPRVILDAGMRHQQGLVGEMLRRGFGQIRHIPGVGGRDAIRIGHYARLGLAIRQGCGGKPQCYVAKIARLPVSLYPITV